ncbi:MAG: NADP oxidoreductase [Sulfurimonas sp.]|nr:NADP oxidoreductase [Sulfurimonas sp.]MBU3938121.1 NADP oxidoreductase [bacterium]MBU4024876.1 NADP oxidoreductase [bacterium]MBU4058244.1 NADP oxidoreductase [bacterium]MBU4109542.1 NADP oxidoreductase [bacterium]
MNKIRLATLWLDGCSGCHMSILDMDEKLVEIAQYVDVVYSPYVDTKEFPENVDLTIVEGALSSDHDIELIQKIRQNSKLILALGDCAITGNISAMKNLFGSEAVLERGYFELADENKSEAYPSQIVPKLLDKVLPLHEVVKVDYFLPGCPTPSQAIYEMLKALIEGKEINISDYTRFGK